MEFRIKIYIALIFFCCIDLFSIAQEHIPNGSFEDLQKCPTDQGQVDYAIDISAHSASPDLFSSCFQYTNQNYTFSLSTPKNMGGYQLPFDGTNYIAVRINKDFYDESIQIELNYKLQTNQHYYLEFYVSTANKSTYGTSSIGAYFFKTQQRRGSAASVSLRNNNTPYIENPEDNILLDTVNWGKISGTFKAQGDEKFIIIGNSKPVKESVFSANPITIKGFRERYYFFLRKRGIEKHGALFSYYYIDAVSLWPVDSLGNKINLYEKKEELDTLQQGESMVLQHIYFNVGESTLLPESYPYLDKIVQTLQEKPEIDIEISGHTDNTGIEKDNMQLSRARAKAVVDYLIKHGINQERLSYKGLGSLQPIEINITEAGRAVNRRVEITILPQKKE